MNRTDDTPWPIAHSLAGGTDGHETTGTDPVTGALRTRFPKICELVLGLTLSGRLKTASLRGGHLHQGLKGEEVSSGETGRR